MEGKTEKRVKEEGSRGSPLPLPMAVSRGICACFKLGDLCPSRVERGLVPSCLFLFDGWAGSPFPGPSHGSFRTALLSSLNAPEA